MKLIQLTYAPSMEDGNTINLDGVKLLINTAQIHDIQTNEDGWSVITMASGQTYIVKESLTEIKRM